MVQKLFSISPERVMTRLSCRSCRASRRRAAGLAHRGAAPAPDIRPAACGIKPDPVSQSGSRRPRDPDRAARNISRAATAKAYSAAFSKEKITAFLTDLPNEPGFRAIDTVRNLVGHRISGRRSVATSGTTHADGTRTEWREDTWYLPGAAGKLVFDEELLQRHLDDITSLLTALASTAREFAQSHQPVRPTP